eukprot:m.39004 g.39004  ORF g.39004 m.39004 type:complete len:109 (+) comp10277_c0_seq1:1336-1662(+)
MVAPVMRLVAQFTCVKTQMVHLNSALFVQVPDRMVAGATLLKTVIGATLCVSGCAKLFKLGVGVLVRGLLFVVLLAAFIFPCILFCYSLNLLRRRHDGAQSDCLVIVV